MYFSIRRDLLLINRSQTMIPVKTLPSYFSSSESSERGRAAPLDRATSRGFVHNDDCIICLDTLLQPEVEEDMISNQPSREDFIVTTTSTKRHSIKLTMLIPCGHQYHSHCFSSWQYQINKKISSLKLLTCPICKVPCNRLLQQTYTSHHHRHHHNEEKRQLNQRDIKQGRWTLANEEEHHISTTSSNLTSQNQWLGEERLQRIKETWNEFYREDIKSYFVQLFYLFQKHPIDWCILAGEYWLEVSQELTSHSYSLGYIFSQFFILHLMRDYVTIAIDWLVSTRQHQARLENHPQPQLQEHQQQPLIQQRFGIIIDVVVAILYMSIVKLEDHFESPMRLLIILVLLIFYLLEGIAFLLRSPQTQMHQQRRKK